MFAAMIIGVEPMPQALVELFDGEVELWDRARPETVRARSGYVVIVVMWPRNTE